jgi:hypothetical protein
MQKMSKKNNRSNRYVKEDLIWEAVRRNEKYKIGFHEIQKQLNDFQSPILEGFCYPPFDIWRTNIAVAPSISAKDLKELSPDEKWTKWHPYLRDNMANTKSKVVIEINDLLKPLSTGWRDINLSDEITAERIMQVSRKLKNHHQNRIFISIDPSVSYKNDIEPLIKEIIFNKRKEIEQDTQTKHFLDLLNEKNENINKNDDLDEDDKFFDFDEIGVEDKDADIDKDLDHFDKDKEESKECNKEKSNNLSENLLYQKNRGMAISTKNINKNIEYLEKYDEIIKVAEIKGSISTKFGVKIVSDKSIFLSMVDDKKKEYDSIVNEVRTWMNQYQHACSLIFYAPNIQFIPGRT